MIVAFLVSFFICMASAYLCGSTAENAAERGWNGIYALSVFHFVISGIFGLLCAVGAASVWLGAW